MIKRNPLPSKAVLDALFNYDPITGLLVWKAISWGRKAGTKTAGGYIAVRVNGQAYQAHRLIWVIMTSSAPADDIDHINRARDDNRWVNLRAATLAQNSANVGKQRNNTTGYKGVGTLPHSPNRWQAQIKGIIYLTPSS